MRASLLSGRAWRRALSLLVLLCGAAGIARGQSRPDTLQGRITTDSAVALSNVEVIVTRGPDRTVFRTRTDATGAWRIIADPGTGDYLVFASADGRLSQRKRVLRAGTETLFTVNLSLASAAPQTLARVEVRATKREPPSTNLAAGEPTRGNAEQEFQGSYSAVAPSDQGNPLALASSIPGLQATGGGISVLGLPGAQTQVTLNGMAGGGELPLGGFTRAVATTTAWDVARGGFSGGQVDVSLYAGGVYSSKQLVVVNEIPQLQATDAVGRALGQRTSVLDVNFSSLGSVDRRDRFGYSLATRLRQRRSDVPAATTASALALDAAGVSRDTVQRLVGALGPLGVPLGSVSGTQRTDAQLALRVDKLTVVDGEIVPNARRYGLSFLYNGSWDEGTGVGPTALPSATATGRDMVGTLQLFHTARAGIWLHDTRTSLVLRDARTAPVFALPGGTVRTVGSTADAGGVAFLTFGGNDRLASDQRRLTWETMQESQVYVTPGTRHRVKLYAQARFDASTQRARPNGLGSFSYNSIDDLLAGRAASFTRTLLQPDRAGRTFNGALGIGSIYRTSPNFAIQYGVRVEANAFLNRPDANAAVRSSLGVRTDAAPADWGISPRLGIRWAFSKKANNNTYTYFSPAGIFGRQTMGVLRGGVGEFRNFISPDNIANAVAATGLPASTLRLFCVGDAVPVADWDTFAQDAAAIPSACANGAPALADRAPAVRILDPGWRPPRSWRANVAWTQRLLRTDMTLDGIASVNLAQPSSADANFAGVSRFTLPFEKGRPVYVSEGSIVPATGALVSTAARRDAAYGSVLVSQAAARSVSTQLRLSLQPDMPRRTSLTVQYVLGQVRARETGLDRNTAGDPRAFEWAAGDLDTRHQVQASLAVTFANVSASLFSNTLSGAPYTPVVSGDINGDGVAGNDRAFVTRGASSSAAFQSAMATMLATAPADARRCLTRSLEQIAGRNSCRGPWSTTLNGRLSLQGRLIGIRRYSTLNLTMRNLLAGIDQAVNGRALKGWGTRAIVDPVLYSVRGYDPTTRRFQYDVNPRFGASNPRFTTLRAPFAVTLDVTVSLGATYPQQQLDRALRNGRNGFPGPRLDSTTLVRRYGRQMQDLYGEILQLSDSLLLTREQLAALQTRKSALDAKVDSVWGAFAAYLVRLEDRYDAKAALSRQTDATDAIWRVQWEDANTLAAVLTPTQMKLLPWPASYLVQVKEPPSTRRFY